ncbi:MAG TPA: hypothetical protein VJ961_02250, partial [Mariprofundaceae bacterium]|nr:hypothetical protein [Mariprofundaceae bacterium]
PGIEVVGLLSTLNARYDRVAMHATRSELLRRQATATGLPLHTLELPDPCSNEQYAAIMGGFVAGLPVKGIDCIAFGDLFLEDIRNYREKQLAGTGIEPIFPLWQIPTSELAMMMLDGGLETYISCVDLQKIPVGFAGRRWSYELLEELPEGVDPCGENGEMHTIVIDGPMFDTRIDMEIGKIVQRDGFAYADIIPIGM